MVFLATRFTDFKLALRNALDTAKNFRRASPTVSISSPNVQQLSCPSRSSISKPRELTRGYHLLFACSSSSMCIATIDSSSTRFMLLRPTDRSDIGIGTVDPQRDKSVRDRPPRVPRHCHRYQQTRCMNQLTVVMWRYDLFSDFVGIGPLTMTHAFDSGIVSQTQRG